MNEATVRQKTPFHVAISLRHGASTGLVAAAALLRRAETACVHATRIVERRQPVLDVGLGGDRLQPVARRARYPGITRLAREPRQQLHREITLRTHFLDAIFIRSDEHTSNSSH